MGVRAFDNNARAPYDGSGKSRPGAAGAGGGDERLATLLLLFASDVVVGVGLRSAMRSFLLSHVPLVEFSTGVEVSVRRLERPEEERTRLDCHPRGRFSKAPFVVGVKGLKNRGQTCYANAVLQALAALQPLHTYLGSMQHSVQNDGEGHENIASALFQTLRYVNGHQATPRGRSNSSFRSLRSLFSSSSPGDPQRVMDIVARQHLQFRSRNNLRMAGMLEQQDCHEFFTGLMDVLSSEDRQGGGSTLPRKGAVNPSRQGLACVNSFIRRKESEGVVAPDISVDLHGEKIIGGGSSEESRLNDVSDPFTNDDLEEEKKHDEHNIYGAVAYQGSHENRSNFTQPQIQREKLNTSTGPTRSKYHPPAVTVSNPVAASTPRSASAIQNPFDGWSGSTIKCARCHHIRPIRSTPFLALSLPIASIRSDFLEDFLAAEYGGFASAEVVSDVQCFSCAIRERVRELEDEEALLSGAISSVRRRGGRDKKVSKKSGNGGDAWEGLDREIVGLVQESQRIKRKIAILETLDPDADDNKLECKDSSRDAELEIELGIDDSLPPIVPLRGDAYKASVVMRPPEALCIHIQRRHYDMSCQRMVKVMRKVQFDEQLDIRPYCAYDAKVPYRLMSVIEHEGNAFGGHYQTYRRVDPERNEWVLVSDESVSLRSWTDVKRCQAYMLFYVASSSNH